MLYIQNLTREEYVDKGKLLNLVLDQLDRKKDLYYKVEIFSTYDFESFRLGKQYPYKVQL